MATEYRIAVISGTTQSETVHCLSGQVTFNSGGFMHPSEFTTACRCGRENHVIPVATNKYLAIRKTNGQDEVLAECDTQLEAEAILVSQGVFPVEAAIANQPYCSGVGYKTVDQMTLHEKMLHDRGRKYQMRLDRAQRHYPVLAKKLLDAYASQGFRPE